MRGPRLAAVLLAHAALSAAIPSAWSAAGGPTPADAPAAPMATLLRPAQVWTAGEPVHTGWVVLTQGERIVAVGPQSAVSMPAGASVIELPGATLMPGLIDAHSHLFLHPYNETLWDDQVLKEPVPYRTLRAARQARATLLAGFTTLRDLGTEGAEYADVALRRAIEEGLIEGPRLFVATRAIVATGTYGPAPRALRPDVCCTPQGAQEASGVAEVIRAVREQAGRGADWIKVYADYQMGSGWHAAAHLQRRGAAGAGRDGALIRAAGGGARHHGRGHAPRGARRRRHHRARLQRYPRGVQAHGRARRRVSADADRRGGLRGVLRTLRARANQRRPRAWSRRGGPSRPP